MYTGAAQFPHGPVARTKLSQLLNAIGKIQNIAIILKKEVSE